MRGFRFRLARLERLRDLNESNERAAYGRAQARCVETEQRIALAQQALAAALDAQREARHSPKFEPAQELAQQALVERLEGHVRQLMVQLRELEHEAEQQRKVWEQARTEQRTLTRLRERDLAEHLAELETREREEQDEWVSTQGARASSDRYAAPDAFSDGPSGLGLRQRS